MFLVDQAEVSGSESFDVVLKLRDDSLALLPWPFPSSSHDITKLELHTLNCLGWGGYMDATFMLGRRFAWTVMEGLSADWYLLHYEFRNRIPHNPETWLKYLSQYHNVPHKETSICGLPFISVRFMSQSGSVKTVTKRVHHQYLKGHGHCFDWGGHEPSCYSTLQSRLSHLQMCPSALCSTRR